MYRHTMQTGRLLADKVQTYTDRDTIGRHCIHRRIQTDTLYRQTYTDRHTVGRHAVHRHTTGRHTVGRHYRLTIVRHI